MYHIILYYYKNKSKAKPAIKHNKRKISKQIQKDSIYIAYLQVSFEQLQKKIDNKIAFSSPYCVTFPKWQSTNHTDCSQSSVSYSFYAFNGSTLTIPYYVSSESNYDYLIITITKGNGPPLELIRVSDTKKGTYTYTCQECNIYKIIIKYQKDGSYSKHEDNGGVNEIKIEHHVFD